MTLSHIHSTKYFVSSEEVELLHFCHNYSKLVLYHYILMSILSEYMPKMSADGVIIPIRALVQAFLLSCFTAAKSRDCEANPSLVLIYLQEGKVRLGRPIT